MELRELSLSVPANAVKLRKGLRRRAGKKMTAEIAILNKSAVALAADSAVTICTGDTDEKIFNSADKLFELSDSNPIGIMIYNSMTFMGTPLPTLIRHFRSNCYGSFEYVEEAAEKFLEFLNGWGKTSPHSVKQSSVEDIIRPFFARFGESIKKEFVEKIMEAERKKEEEPYDASAIIKSTIDRHIRLYEFIYKRRKDASFVGGFDFKFSATIDELLHRLIKRFVPPADAEQTEKLSNIGQAGAEEARFLRGTNWNCRGRVRV